MKRIRWLVGNLTVAAAALLLIALPARAQDIVEIISRNPDLSTFAQLVKAAGLEQAMKAPGPLTVLVPTNAAFARLDPANLEKMKQPDGQPIANSVVRFHVLPGSYPKDRLSKAYLDSFKVTTSEGNPVQVETSLLKKKTGPLIIDNQRITRDDVKASNGSVYVIDAVMLPPKYRSMAPKPVPAAAPAAAAPKATTPPPSPPAAPKAAPPSPAPAAPAPAPAAAPPAPAPIASPPAAPAPPPPAPTPPPVVQTAPPPAALPAPAAAPPPPQSAPEVKRSVPSPADDATGGSAALPGGVERAPTTGEGGP